MNLKIIKKNRETIDLCIIENGQLLDLLIIAIDIHFDTVLVTSIDKLLKRNRITRVSSLEVVLEGFEDESSMSFLIAKTVAEALKIK